MMTHYDDSKTELAITVTYEAIQALKTVLDRDRFRSLAFRLIVAGHS